MPRPSSSRAFDCDNALARLVSGVRRALVLRAALRTLAWASLLFGAPVLLLAWWMPSLPRWPAVGLVCFAPALAALVAWRRLPAGDDLVLFVDLQLGADQSIVSAWEGASREGPLAVSVRASAERHLARARSRDVRPGVFPRALWLLPLGSSALAWAFWLPIPRPVPPPARDEVRLVDTPALEEVASLPLFAFDEEEREELEALAAKAETLRARLAEGMERREALDAIEDLEDAALAARRVDTPHQQRARDAALEALEGETEMARALAERDLEGLDRAVTRAAARREAADRERARAALAAAAAAARAEGDAGLAESLLQRRRLLARRSQQAELARQLAEAMPELMGRRLRRQLARLERDGDGEGLNQAMVDAMREAWESLSEEERRRLAEALQNAGAAENDIAREREEARDGSRPLSADEYERMLRDALENLERLQLRAGGAGGEGMPLPSPGGGQLRGGQGGQASGSAPEAGQEGPGRGASGQGASGQGASGQGASGQGASRQGSSGGAAVGPAGGPTAALGGDEGVLARVRPRVQAGAPARSWAEWVDPEGAPLPERGAGAGEPATTSAEGRAGGVERGFLPEEYREQVQVYFGGDTP